MESKNVNQQLVKIKLSPEEIERIKNNKVTVNLGLPINLDNLQEYSNIKYFGVNNRYPKRNVQTIHAPYKKHLLPSEFSGLFDMTFLCSESPPMKQRRRKRKVEVVETTVSCLDHNQIKKRKLQCVEKTTGSNKNYNFGNIIKTMKRLCKMINITKIDSHHLIRRTLLTTNFLSVIKYDQKKNNVFSYPILLDKLFTTIQKNQLSIMQPLSYSSVIIIKNQMKNKINRIKIKKVKAVLTNDLKNNSSSSVNAGFLPRIEHDYKTGEPSEDINKNIVLCNVIRGGQNNVFDFSDVKFISDLIEGNNESLINITGLIEKKLDTHSNNSVLDNGDAQHSKEVSTIRCGSAIDSRPSVREITEGTTVVVDSELLNSFQNKILTDNMIDKNIFNKLQSQFKFTKTKDYRKLIEYNYRMMAYTRIPSAISTNLVLKYPDKTNMPMCSLDMHLKHNLDILKYHTLVATEQKPNHHGIEFNYVKLMKSAILLDVGQFYRNCTPLEMKINKMLPKCHNCISFKIISSNKKHKNICQIIEKGIYCTQKIFRGRGNMKFATNTTIIKKGRNLYIVMHDKMRGVLDLKVKTISSSEQSIRHSKISHFLRDIKVRLLATEDNKYDIETLMDQEDGRINDISVLLAKDFNIDFIDLTNNDEILPSYYLNNKTKKNMCDIMIRIMKTNYSFFKFRNLCNDSVEIKAELIKAGLPIALEDIVGLDIVPFVRIYLKWFDDEYSKSMQFDGLGIAILKTMISFLKETNPTTIHLATIVINNSLSTLYSYRFDTFSKPSQPFKMNLTTDNVSENNCNDEAEKVNNSTSLVVDDLQLCVKTDLTDIIDNDRILNNIKVKSRAISSSGIVNLIDDTYNINYDHEIVMCDISKFNYLGMFRPNRFKNVDYFNKKDHSSVDFMEFDVSKSIPDNNIYDDVIMDQSVNQILDINLNFHDFKTEEESSLLSACEQLLNISIPEITIPNNDLDVNDKSSSNIDLPLSFDNAGTLLP